MLNVDTAFYRAQYDTANDIIKDGVDRAYQAARKSLEDSGFVCANDDRAEALVSAIMAYLTESAEPIPAYNESLAMSQGWLLANDGERLQIQRYDIAEKFDSDNDALAYVRSLSSSGDAHAAYCLNRASYTA